jgi:c(7)-type cytochrome triheme protein
MRKYNTAVLAAVLMLLALACGAGAGENTNGGGEIVYTKPVKAVLFSHKAHVEQKGLSCDLCHSQFFEMQALKVQGKTDFNMEGLAQGKYCGVCHNGTMAFSSNSRCASCHTGVKGS